jgi:hypothetical protein
MDKKEEEKEQRIRNNRGALTTTPEVLLFLRCTNACDHRILDRQNEEMVRVTHPPQVLKKENNEWIR